MFTTFISQIYRQLQVMFAAFKYRNYRIFWIGNFVSLIGSWMQSMALSWLIYRITLSPFLLGLSSFFSSIPIVLVSPIGGAYVDLLEKRKILICTQAAFMLSAFILSALTGFNLIKVWHILALAIFGGFIAAFDGPARQAFVVELVGKDALMNGIALNSLAFNSARILGPVAAGYAVVYIKETGCFIINGISFVAVIIALMMMTNLRAVNEVKKSNLLKNLLEGFRYLRHQKIIRHLLMLVGIFSILAQSYTTLLPVFAKTILNGDAKTFARLMAAVGVGAIGGALVVARLGNYQKKGKLLLTAAFCSNIFLILFGISPWFWLSLVTLTVVGFSNVTYLATTNTSIQTLVSDEFRGRVISIYTLIFLAGMPVGNLIAGTIATYLGAPLTVVLTTTLCLIYFAFTTYKVPELYTA